ncbi:hypothetical protein E0D86_06505 [Pseudomonas sp. IC_126]|uniref:hypothetical protein n=1 Tax=Pseudomonas sp. IC_126 TaxID=2547400 RepID=UPI001039F353|nr:hypothetical protein [Pseudomonas sp. IC_126]TCD22308.1 hypothetical protein E0D86_06505 [Pseudomonas sp. IC_126]
MITSEKIPSGYTPYHSINFCSNEIVGGGHIFAMGKVVPLLIGTGPKPKIWLQAITSPSDKSFITIVDESIAKHPSVRVTEQDGKVIVIIHGKTVLAVEAISTQKAIVSELDLRPIGLNVYGNSLTLHLGGMQLSNNTFSGVGTAFGLGE